MIISTKQEIIRTPRARERAASDSGLHSLPVHQTTALFEFLLRVTSKHSYLTTGMSRIPPEQFQAHIMGNRDGAV